MQRLLLFILFFCFSSHLTGEENPNVVCIHGFMVTHRSMRMVGRFLECGGANAYVWSYPSRKRFITDHACHLVAYLQEIAAANPGKPIHFVAHSTGGLILRAALNLPDCPLEAKIGRAVLLAPPNKGAELARRFRNLAVVRFAMGTKSGCELMYYCPWNVSRLGEYPESMDIMVIAGYRGSDFLFDQPNDGFLTLRETALDGPHRRVELHISHDQMVKNRAVLSFVNSFIIRGCTNEPTRYLYH